MRSISCVVVALIVLLVLFSFASYKQSFGETNYQDNRHLSK